MTNPDLAALSAAATQGEWRAEQTFLLCAEEYAAPNLYGANFNGKAPMADFSDGEYTASPNPNQDAAFIVALVNAYRTGNLVQFDREGMRERVWHDYRFQAACHRYAHEGGSSEAIAAAAIAAILGGGQ